MLCQLPTHTGWSSTRASERFELAGWLVPEAQRCQGALPANTSIFPNRCQSGQHRGHSLISPGAALIHCSQCPRCFGLSQLLAALPGTQPASHLLSQGSPGSRERMDMQWCTSALGQHYTSFLLTFTSVNKQCLETVESKQDKNCFMKTCTSHMNALRSGQLGFIWLVLIN